MKRSILLAILLACAVPVAHAQRDPSTGRGRSDEAHGRSDEAHGRSDEAHGADEAPVAAQVVAVAAEGARGRSAEAREEERGRSWRSTARRLGLDPEREGPSAIDAQMRAELARHARRVARIDRVRALGVELARPEVTARAERLAATETARHERRLAAIAGHPLAPAEPAAAIAIDPTILVAPVGVPSGVVVTPPPTVTIVPPASGVVVTPPVVAPAARGE